MIKLLIYMLGGKLEESFPDPASNDYKNQLIGFVGNQESSDSSHGIIKSCYSLLSILDTKATALLTFNAIIFATFSLGIFSDTPLSNSEQNSELSGLGLWLSVWGIIFAFSAIIACHTIIYVFWARTKSTQREADQDVLDAIYIVLKRTVRYRKAFMLSLYALVLLAANEFQKIASNNHFQPIHFSGYSFEILLNILFSIMFLFVVCGGRRRNRRFIWKNGQAEIRSRNN
ncbi:MAG: hypothetical protein AAFV51_06830 [Pseudomonadota bacterium]